MKVRHTSSHISDKVELQMTPMIDIVFQLIAFFLFTFKFASVEGDFNIKMPVVSASASQAPVDTLPIKLRLEAKPDGTLAKIVMGEQNLGTSFGALRSRIISTIGRDDGPNSAAAKSEIELDCDYNLHYVNVVAAINAVTGFIEGGETRKMIQKVKFSPPKRPK